MLAPMRLAVLLVVLLTAGCAEFRYGSTGLPPRADGPTPAVYVVDRGDTLYSIAWRYELDYRAVARWNGIRPPYTIYPDQRLRLRPPPGTRQRPTTAVVEPRPIPEPEPLPEPTPSPPETGPEPADIGWRWPTDGEVVRDFDPNRAGKKGITIAGEVGQPIRAAASGRVVYSGNGLRGYGNLIIIKHSRDYLTAYGYNRELLADEGDRVDAGELIARMGEAPSQGAVLHFEIRREGEPVDPSRYLP